MGINVSRFTDLKSTCQNLQLAVQCNSTFHVENATEALTVSGLGPVSKTMLLEADPDIAGNGVLFAFWVPNGVILLLCLLIIIFRIEYMLNPKLRRETVGVPRTTAHNIKSGLTSIIPNKRSNTKTASNQQPVQSRPRPRPQYQATSPVTLSEGNHNSNYLQSNVYVAPGNQFPSEMQHQPHYQYPAPTAFQSATFTPAPPSPTIEAPRTPTTPLPPPSPSPQKNEPSSYTSEVNLPDTVTTSKTRPTSESDKKSPSEIGYDPFEAALLSISDSQLLLSAALVINFANTGLCTTSRYHFNIGLHLILLACWSSIISITILRNFWKAPFTAFVRVAVLLSLIGSAGWLILTDRYGVFAEAEYTAEYLPPPVEERRDSLLLLPAACFIDRNLHNETFSQLLGDQARLDALGARQTDYERWETALWSCIIPVALMCIPVSFCQIRYNLRHNANTVDEVWPGKLEGKRRRWAVVFYWLAPWIAGVVYLGWVIHYILDVKAWIHASGWMSEEGVYAESFVRGMGQIAPVVAVGAVALASLEKWVCPIPR